MSDEEIVGLNIPTARPLVYEFDDDMKPIRHYVLGNADEIAAAMAGCGSPRQGQEISSRCGTAADA